MPETADEKVREIISETGFPLQHYCASHLSKIPNMEISVEYPFTHPPTNGPLLGIHGAIDIIASCPSTNEQGLLVTFVVECKKASDKIKNWIFLKDEHRSPKWPTFMFSPVDEAGNERLGITRSITFPDLNYPTPEHFDFCVNGIEVNNHLKAINRTPEEKIFKPLTQVAHGTRAFESTIPKIVDGIDYFRDRKSYPTYLYIPVIVTTAHLYMPDFEIADINNGSGEIKKEKLRLGEEKKWVSFETPLPDYLGYSVTRPDGVANVHKRTVFIVNSKHIDEFFKGTLTVYSLNAVPGAI